MTIKLNTFLTRSGVDAIRSGNPWILSGQLKPSYKAILPKQPAIVPLGEHWFWYSPHSDIRLRRMGPALRYWPTMDENQQRDIIINLDDFNQYFLKYLEQELISIFKTKQRALGDEKSLRWIFGDNDGFGGLVLDVFDNYIVAQIQSAPIEVFWPSIKSSIQKSFFDITGRTANVIERRDGAIRKKEGLAVLEFTSKEYQTNLQWNGLNWSFNPYGNQKTGAYLDQKENHLRAVAWAKRLNCVNVWDICCFEGGFGIHLAKAGLQVSAVDSSVTALEKVKLNAQLNHCDINLNTVKSDAFDFLRDKHKNSQKVDMIVLDPPALAPNKQSIGNAMKAYRELNLRAIHCLVSGGLLVTCSCSHVFTKELFIDMLCQAEHHTRRKLRILEIAGPASDHMASLQLSQSDYLQAYFIEVI